MITQEQLKEHVHYNPTTGIFTRRRAKQSSPIGTVLDTRNAGGYLHFSVCAHRTTAHRWAFLYMTGAFPPDLVDHINGVRDDNRWCNLRNADAALNAQNRGKKCYAFAKGRTKPWRADITIGGKRHTQSFILEQDAIEFIKQIKQESN